MLFTYFSKRNIGKPILPGQLYRRGVPEFFVQLISSERDHLGFMIIHCVLRGGPVVFDFHSRLMEKFAGWLLWHIKAQSQMYPFLEVGAATSNSEDLVVPRQGLCQIPEDFFAGFNVLFSDLLILMQRADQLICFGP